MNDSVVAIVTAFFLMGITVGIIIVVALSALHSDRRRDPGNLGDPPHYGPGHPSGPPPDAGPHDAGPDDQPSWPEGPGWR
jgi:hypothetical protein